MPRAFLLAFRWGRRSKNGKARTIVVHAEASPIIAVGKRCVVILTPRHAKSAQGLRHSAHASSQNNTLWVTRSSLINSDPTVALLPARLTPAPRPTPLPLTSHALKMPETPALHKPQVTALSKKEGTRQETGVVHENAKRQPHKKRKKTCPLPFFSSWFEKIISILKNQQHLSLRSLAKDVRVTSVRDGQHRYAEVLPARGAKVGVGPGVVVHGALGEHGKVLNLRLAQGGAVVRDENHLGAGATHRLDGGLVAQGSLARLHDQLKPSVHRLDGLLLLSSWGQVVS